MVKIIYLEDINNTKIGSVDYKNIAEFLLKNFSTRDQLLDLRFFHEELLGTEINQAGGDFIDIDDGTVVVVHDSQIPKGPETWIFILVATVVGVAAAVSLIKPDVPDMKNQQQQSATNRLGDTSNEPRINQRIDDIFGKVTKHTVPLWQVPYRIGIDDQEVEILFTCVGRGKYQINLNEWYDGDTPVINIQNAAVNVYGPHTHPSNGSPELQIGQLINEPIGIYRQSNDLNPAELLPPNENENSGITWKASGTTTVATLTASFIPEGYSLLDNYTVGDTIGIKKFVYINQIGTKTLYLDPLDPPVKTVTTYSNPIDLSSNGTVLYTILAVTATTLQLSIPSTASTAIKNAWAAMTDYFFPRSLVNIISDLPTNTYIKDETVVLNDYYEKSGSNFYPITAFRINYQYTIGAESDGTIGPIYLPVKATEVLLNFVSASGFYKLIENVETAIVANIDVVFRELDSNNVATGEQLTYNFEYSSNDSIRRSVFRSLRMEIPYTNCTIECKRTTIRDKNDNVANVDNVEWRDLYTFEPVNVTDFGDVTTAHVMIPSNSQSRLVKQRKQNVTVTRKITPYLGNGNFGPAESLATESFEQILIHTALDPYIGRLTLNDINADGFLELRDEITDYFGSDIMCKFGYDFDSDGVTYQDIYTTICNAVMCIPYTQYGIYDAFFERQQSTSAMQITCRNKITGTETRSFSYDRKYDGVEVTYRSNDTGAPDTIYVPDDRSSKNPERVTLSGCTTELQAYRYAHRMYNRQKYQTTVVKFDVDDFGRNVIVGRRFDSPDSTRFTVRENAETGYRVFDGEVVEVNGLEVELSIPVVFTAGEDHYITFTKIDGDSTESILCTQVDDYTVLLSTVPTIAIYDGYEHDRTKFVLVSEQLKQSVALLPKTIEYSLSDDGSEVHTINSVNYTDKYYQNDLDQPE